jgi:hypothetical protein
MTPQEAYAKIVEENGGVAPETGLYIDESTNTLWILTGRNQVLAIWEPTHMFKDMTRTQLLRFIRENMIE